MRQVTGSPEDQAQHRAGPWGPGPSPRGAGPREGAQRGGLLWRERQRWPQAGVGPAGRGGRPLVCPRLAISQPAEKCPRSLLAASPPQAAGAARSAVHRGGGAQGCLGQPGITVVTVVMRAVHNPTEA